MARTFAITSSRFWATKTRFWCGGIGKTWDLPISNTASKKSAQFPEAIRLLSVWSDVTASILWYEQTVWLNFFSYLILRMYFWTFDFESTLGGSTRLDSGRVESSRRVSIQNPMFRSTFLISRMRRNSGIHFTSIMVLKHQRRTIRKANGQLQEIATISWKQYLRFEDLRFFSVYSHQNLVFIAQRRLKVIEKVLCSLHSMYCFYFLSIFGGSLSEKVIFYEFSTLFQSLELSCWIVLDHFLARLRKYCRSISSSHKCPKTIRNGPIGRNG